MRLKEEMKKKTLASDWSCLTSLTTCDKVKKTTTQCHHPSPSLHDASCFSLKVCDICCKSTCSFGLPKTHRKLLFLKANESQQGIEITFAAAAAAAGAVVGPRSQSTPEGSAQSWSATATGCWAVVVACSPLPLPRQGTWEGCRQVAVRSL